MITSRLFAPDPASAVWATGQGSSGLVGQYFNSADLSGSPMTARVDAALNIASFDATNVPVSNPSPAFRRSGQGTVQPTISGDQVFKVASGGIVRLYVNNQLIIDNFSNTSTPSVPVVGKIALQAGVAYSVRLKSRIIPDTFFGPGGLSGF